MQNFDCNTCTQEIGQHLLDHITYDMMACCYEDLMRNSDSTNGTI